MTWRLVLKSEAEIGKLLPPRSIRRRKPPPCEAEAATAASYGRNRWIRFLIDRDDKAPFGLSV